MKLKKDIKYNSYGNSWIYYIIKGNLKKKYFATYIESDNLKKIKNSDKIYLEMKKL